ncbi:MAG: MCE family protein [Candidatus Dadabacteria bacterium]|nr:MAG: MCE family protein [Candidatus Dadabacteria bacterium]
MKHSYEFQAGLFLIVAICAVALSVWYLGKDREIFSDQEEFVTTFRDVKGLKEGAPVRFGGITVGRVDKIGFGPDMNNPTVYVRFLVNERYLHHIRTSTVAELQTQGLLGDRFLALMPGGKGTIAKPGSLIKSHEGSEIEDVLNKASRVVDNTVDISESVKDFLKAFKTDTQPKLTEAAKHLAAITKEIEEGDGMMHQLIYSKEAGDKIIKSLSSITSDLKSVMAEVKNGEGLLHALVYDPDGGKAVSSLVSAANNLSTTAEHINALAAEIRNGSGLLHGLVYEKAPSDAVSKIIINLNKTAENLEKASRALADGSGTIGALLIDSKLYDNLVEVTDGAKRSLILRHAIRQSLKDAG